MNGLRSDSTESDDHLAPVSTSQDVVSWKYARDTPSNTSQSSFGRIDYLSNLKWLLLAMGPLIQEVENWPTVLQYYLFRKNSPSVTFRFRNHDVLVAPKNYAYSAIAETLFTDTYRFRGAPKVVVDIGASIGDFALLASRNQTSRVYSFEKDPGYFQYLQENMRLNRRKQVRVFKETANRNTLESIIGAMEERIDFLKVDCEGCEYGLLLKCPASVLSRIGFIALEIHDRPPYSKSSLISHLQGSGFQVLESRPFGRGHHLYASNGF